VLRRPPPRHGPAGAHRRRWGRASRRRSRGWRGGRAGRGTACEGGCRAGPVLAQRQAWRHVSQGAEGV
jgi:hypothetical protein